MYFLKHSTRKTKKQRIRNSKINGNMKIKLLIENKLIIRALGNLHYKISREKFEPEPGFKPLTS